MKIILHHELRDNLESFVGKEFQLLYRSRNKYKSFPTKPTGIIIGLDDRSKSVCEYSDTRIFIYYIKADGEKDFCYLDIGDEWAIICE